MHGDHFDLVHWIVLGSIAGFSRFCCWCRVLGAGIFELGLVGIERVCGMRLLVWCFHWYY